MQFGTIKISHFGLFIKLFFLFFCDRSRRQISTLRVPGQTKKYTPRHQSGQERQAEVTEREIKLDRLQKMAESETDPEKKATLRWAIFRIESGTSEVEIETEKAAQEAFLGAVLATFTNLNMSETDRNDVVNTLYWDTLRNPNYDPATLRSIYMEWQNR